MTDSDVLSLVSGSTDIQVSTEIATSEITGLTRTTSFLPRISVCGSTTDLVQQGKMAVGTHALVRSGSDFVDLGKSFSFLAIMLRPKALKIPKDKSAPVSYYKQDSAAFKKVQADSMAGPMNGNMWGPEFLIWVPKANSFASYFCSSATMRNAAPDLLTIMKKEEAGGKSRYVSAPATSETHFIIGKVNKWWGARFLPCTTPLPPVENPDEWMEKFKEEVEKFKNPPESEVEVVDAPAASGRAR